MSTSNAGPTTRVHAPGTREAGGPPRDEPDPTAPERREPLLAAICHDLRAPLAAVTMGANFVLQTTPDDEARVRPRRVLSAILRSCKQMDRLIRDFGDLSEIEAAVVELRMGVHDAGQILEMAAESARSVALARNVDIVVTPPAEPSLVRCDRERMLRAIGHIVDNASRLAPNESSIELSVRELGGYVHFAVTDHGPGISDETLAHLYDRTWHAHRADRPGAGLGLAIARGFIVAHGGRIDVESKPGETTFSLIITKDVPSSSRNVTEGIPES